MNNELRRKLEKLLDDAIDNYRIKSVDHGNYVAYDDDVIDSIMELFCGKASNQDIGMTSFGDSDIIVNDSDNDEGFHFRDF